MALAFERPTRAHEFLARVGRMLSAHEAENNLIFGLSDVMSRHPDVYPERRFVIATDGGEVVGAALQTPPHNMILSTMRAAHAAALGDRLAADDPALPGVLGPTEVVRAFVDAYVARTGRRASVVMKERIFRADRVVTPAPAPGQCRDAGEPDRALLAAWAEAFRAEAVPGVSAHETGAATADRWLRRAGRTIYLWHDGTPAALAGVGGLTPNGIRVGPVYTPPDRRRRGYASSLVAAITQQQLDEGRRFCFLFTDLANPTSNKIYQAVGYAPVIDVDQWQLADA